MDIENYRNFLAIIEAGSITGAAEIVHIAQPALSKQLRALEQFYGTKLLLTARGTRQIILTDAGRIVYQKAKYICSLEDLARTETNHALHKVVGTLKMSVTNSRAALLIHKSLQGFNQLYPQVHFVIYEAGVMEQSRQLLDGVTELGIFSTPVKAENGFELLFERGEILAAVCLRQGTYLQKSGQAIALRTLENLPVSTTAGCSGILQTCCAAQKITLPVLSVCTARHTALQWAIEDRAVAVVALERKEKVEAGLTVKEIMDTGTSLYKSVVKVKGRPLSPLALKYVEYYNEHSDSRRVCEMEKLRQESKSYF